MFGTTAFMEIPFSEDVSVELFQVLWAVNCNTLIKNIY